ncbi:MAG: neutral/alkaline non-lysosomal ceramidase N-terminal domain-containing protein [Candidatus Helarchaeota archaeon]
MSLNSRVGFSAIKITPKENGIPLGGYYVRYSTGIHDDVYVRSLYLTDGTNEVLLISTDLVSLYSVFVQQMRRKIHEKTIIPERNIMICCLHDHSSPDTNGLTNTKGYLKYTLNPDWFKIIRKKIILSAIQAKKNALPAKLGVKQVPPLERLVVNRRHPLRPLNYKLNFIKICDPNDDLLGIIANYAIHGTTLNARNLLISAEYPGYMIRKLEKDFPKSFAMYLNGPCGDINPNLFPKDIPYEKIDFDYYFEGEYSKFNELAHYGHTKHIGEALATNIINNLEDVDCSDIKEIKVIQKEIKFPVIISHPKMTLTDRILAKVKLVLFKFLKFYNRSNFSYFNYEFIKGKPWIKTEIQLIRINSDILIVALPVELFSGIGEEIVKKSPFKHTIIVELANDYVGYVYPIDECEYGGYEIFGIASFVGIGAGFYIKNKVLKMFEEIK